MSSIPLILSPPEEVLARQVLHHGLHIRQLMARAPFFGPHTDPEVEQQVWNELSDTRAALAAVLDALAEPELRAHFMLEAEGVGEKYYTALLHLQAEHTSRALTAEERTREEEALFEREMTFLRGRIAALRGEWDPEYRALEENQGTAMDPGLDHRG